MRAYEGRYSLSSSPACKYDIQVGSIGHLHSQVSPRPSQLSSRVGIKTTFAAFHAMSLRVRLLQQPCYAVRTPSIAGFGYSTPTTPCQISSSQVELPQFVNSPVQSFADLNPTVSSNEFSVQMHNPDLQPALVCRRDSAQSSILALLMLLILFGFLRTGDSIYTRHVCTQTPARGWRFALLVLRACRFFLFVSSRGT